MAVSKVKAIRTICKRITATPYKKNTLFKINYDTKYKKIYMYICLKKTLPVAVLLLKKNTS